MTAKEIVDKMMATDAMSQWLGINIINVVPDACELEMTVTEEMVNGFNIAHGGITYALSDSCLAFSSNANGRIAVSVETSISHLKAVQIGDKLTAIGSCLNKSNKVGTYQVTTFNQHNDKVAHFKGTVYFKSATH